MVMSDPNKVRTIELYSIEYFDQVQNEQMPPCERDAFLVGTCTSRPYRVAKSVLFTASIDSRPARTPNLPRHPATAQCGRKRLSQPLFDHRLPRHQAEPEAAVDLPDETLEDAAFNSHLAANLLEESLEDSNHDLYASFNEAPCGYDDLRLKVNLIAGAPVCGTEAFLALFPEHAELLRTDLPSLVSAD